MKELSIKNSKLSASVTLAITAKAKKMKANGENVIFFSVGEPDFITPTNIRNAAKEAMDSGFTGYTAASGLPVLRSAICKKLKEENNLEYAPDNIVVSNGAKHAIYNALQAICNPNDEVIIACPYWVSYPELIKMADAIPVIVNTLEENNFKITYEELNNALTSNTKAIIINSPNNPTGTVYSKQDLEMIAQFAVENDLYVISDEIYEKLIYDGTHISIASLNEQIKERTIVINGMSKCYAMTGWRIGYSAANKEITKIISNTQSHATSNPNTIAQYASLEGLNGPKDSLEEMSKEFFKRRNYMVERINNISNLSCQTPPGAFYIMMNVEKLLNKKINEKKITSSLQLAEIFLDECKVAVIAGEGFGIPGYIRLSYATSIENIKEGLDRIENLINTLLI